MTLHAGRPDARLWLVASEPYAGQQGEVLASALRAAGLTDSVHLAVLGAHTEAAITQHKPTVIVAFGATVARALVPTLPDEPMGALRGYLWDTPVGRVLTTVALGDVVTAWTPWRALLDFDLRRAATEVAMGAPPLTTRSVTVCTTIDDVHQLSNFAEASPLLSVDIENTHDLQLACCGFAPTPERAWVIPAHAPWQRDAIRMLCESPVPKVLQNGQYDRFFLKRFAGITLRNQAFDTQLAWHALNPELSGKKTAVGDRKARGGRRTVKSLYFLASIYLRAPWWKDYGFVDDDAQYRLNGLDVCHTLEIAQKQAAQLGVA